MSSFQPGLALRSKAINLVFESKILYNSATPVRLIRFPKNQKERITFKVQALDPSVIPYECAEIDNTFGID